MNGREIWLRYRIKKPLFPYLIAIGETPGINNDAIAKVVNRSPQITGRMTRDLAAVGLIRDLNADDATIHRAWVVNVPEALTAVLANKNQ